ATLAGDQDLAGRGRAELERTVYVRVDVVGVRVANRAEGDGIDDGDATEGLRLLDGGLDVVRHADGVLHHGVGVGAGVVLREGTDADDDGDADDDRGEDEEDELL